MMSAISSAVEKCVIIGSGPSAWTAALYAARANLKPLVYPGRLSESMMPGGQLMTTTEVDNFPGFTDGVTGPRLVDAIRDQAMRWGVRIATDNGPEDTLQKFGDDVNVTHWRSVDRVDLSTGSPFTIFDDAGDSVKTMTIIVATGASANYLGLPSEKAFYNRGVSACAVCDGAAPRFRNAPLIVVGGGDSAVEEATYLSKFASEVYIVHRRDKLRASKVMQERAFANHKIKFLWNREVVEVLGEEKKGVTGVRLKSTVDDKVEDFPCTGFFLAVGHTPTTAFLGGQVKLTESKYIDLVVPHRTDTSVPGVFASGDCADSYYKQAITAAGTGCAAALDAEKWLAARGIE